MPLKAVPGFMAPDLGKAGRTYHKGIDWNGEELIKAHVAKITERSSENGVQWTSSKTNGANCAIGDNENDEPSKTVIVRYAPSPKYIQRW